MNMATIKEEITLKFQTTKDGDIEETSFSAGDEVSVIQEWAHHFLIKDDDGHFYNVAKDKIDNT